MGGQGGGRGGKGGKKGKGKGVGKREGEGKGKGSLAKGSTDGFNNDGWAWGFNNKHRPAGSGTVSQKRREAYRPRQRNREEQNARGIRTPSQPRNDEKARLEKEEKERKEKEEEEALVKRKPGIKEEEQTLAKRKEAIEEEERALAKRKEAIEEEEALHKKKQQEEEAALAKRKEQEEKEALAKRKEQEEEEALAKSAEKDFGPSEKELQKQKMVAKEESWVQVVKKGKKRPSPSPNPSSPDWGGSSSSSSPDPCRKDPSKGSRVCTLSKGLWQGGAQGKGAHLGSSRLVSHCGVWRWLVGQGWTKASRYGFCLLLAEFKVG